ncbi:class I SAM-dependent methyltransferase [Spongisporangium articulatum]|uniref:Class I SAM-dependent methyltransferase n=1 Tax=Spongisporangium articulatum TaxID=3362603 RepID=A0ABW8AHR8_9ACTN
MVELSNLAAHFDAKYDVEPDPWRYRDSWYERRKYAITVSCLPRPAYRAVWEPGCSIGELTVLLAARAERVDACDISRAAVFAARQRTADLPNVRVEQAALPTCPPGASYDLVVLSEVLYYLDESDRDATLQRAEAAVEPGGDLVVVHWRHHPEDAWAAGETVNDQVRHRPGWAPVVRHEEADFVLDVLTRR